MSYSSSGATSDPHSLMWSLLISTVLVWIGIWDNTDENGTLVGKWSESNAQNYDNLVNLVRRASNKNIPRGCRTSYVCGVNDQKKDMYEYY